eukprot:3753133-Prymnesium_polylepis.1
MHHDHSDYGRAVRAHKNQMLTELSRLGIERQAVHERGLDGAAQPLELRRGHLEVLALRVVRRLKLSDGEAVGEAAGRGRHVAMKHHSLA